jgi:putative ABC transport system ATP-binding protein
MVFQDYALFPHMTVKENIAFGLRQRALVKSKIDDRVGALLSLIRLSGFERRYPEQLSGGQQQRVAIGRALAPKPLLLLADEPTGNLDEDTADGVLALARDLVARSGCGFLMVTHSARLAATLDRRVTLHAGLIS